MLVISGFCRLGRNLVIKAYPNNFIIKDISLVHPGGAQLSLPLTLFRLPFLQDYMGRGKQRRVEDFFGSMNPAPFSFPSNSNSLFTKRRCVGLDIFTWFVSFSTEKNLG